MFIAIIVGCSAENVESRVKRGLHHWGHADVNIPDSWVITDNVHSNLSQHYIFISQHLEDNVGVFGDFRISRNITTAEGCKVCCKYMVHYDLLAKEIQFVGRRQGARCIKQDTDACPRSRSINRRVNLN